MKKKLFIWVAASALATSGWANFKIVAIPDTQYLANWAPSQMNAQMQWISDNVSAQNIKFVSHLGDVVDDSDEAFQWVNADASLDILDGAGVPYSICIGNHDYTDLNDRLAGVSEFASRYGSSHYSGYSWYKGSYGDLNHYQIFSAEGRDYLHINLEYMANSEVLLWAQRVIDAHPTLPVILSSHSFLKEDGVLGNDPSTSTFGAMSNGGRSMWYQFVAHNDQIFMVLNGHHFVRNPDDGTANITMINDYGREVFLLCINYQYDQWDSSIRILEFDTANDLIKNTTYDPYDGSTHTDSESQFNLSIDFSARLANFNARETFSNIQVANITVVENDLNNNNNSVTVSIATGQSTDDISVIPVGTTTYTDHSNGDYFLQVGSVAEDDRLGGILIASVANNGRVSTDGTNYYHIASGNPTSRGVYQVCVATTANTSQYPGYYGGAERDVNVAVGYFPFQQGWIAGHVETYNNGTTNWCVTGTPGVSMYSNLATKAWIHQWPQGTHTIQKVGGATAPNWTIDDPDRGLWDVILPGVDSINDGLFLVCSGKNEDNYASASPYRDGHGWQVAVSDSGSGGHTESDPWNFVYIPYSTRGIIAGRATGKNSIPSGTKDSSGNYNFTAVSNAVGTVRLDISGYTPTDGTLLVYTENEWYNADDITTYQPDGTGWLIQTRDLTGATLGSASSTQFGFVFIPFDAPIDRPGPRAGFNDSVTWGGGTGSWVDTNNWAVSEAFDRWGPPGWLSGNPMNIANSTWDEWHNAKVYVSSGTAQVLSTGTQLDSNMLRLHVGRNDGSSSTATVNIASDLTVRENTYMGYKSLVGDVATINQTAGDVAYGTSGFSRTYWARGKGESVYNLSGGTMTLPGDWDQFGNNIVDSDDGASVFTFNQTGGTFTDSGASGFVMSDKAPSISHVNISGGTFNANAAASTRIGHWGITTMNISGASTVVSMTSKEVGIGYYANATDLGTGTITMSNGTFTASNPAGDDIFSIGRSGSGTFTQLGGTVDLEGMNETFVGRYSAQPGASQGTLNISDGIFKANRLHVGRDNNAVGIINQTGGTATAGAYSTLGMYAGSSGTINMDGGTMEFNSSGVSYIGRSGEGTINQTGGAITFAGETSLGRYGSSTGTVNLSGGSFTVMGNILYVGYDASGVFNQTGGDLNVGWLRLAQNNVAATGLYSISGGSLNVSAYITGGLNGTGTFEVIGSGATNISAANISFYDDTLRVILDSNGSTLMVADKSINTAYNGEVDLRGVFEIGTTNGFNGQPGDVYDIAWASDGVLTNGLVFSNLTSETFDWRVVDKNGGKMLQVYIPDTPLVNYDYWLRDYPALGNATNKADNPDGDAVNNLAEYALGGDPSDAQSQGYLPESVLQEAGGTNYVEYVYARRNDYIQRGLDYSLELNTNLVSGVWSNAGPIEVGSSALDAEFDAVTNHIPTDGKDQEFIHLRVDSQ